MTNIKARVGEKLNYVKGNRGINISLFVIIAIGAALRYYGLDNAESTDEYNEVFEALRLASGQVNVNRWLKKGYQTFLAIEYGIYFISGWIIGVFKNPMHFASIIVADMSPLFVIGRVTTASLGVLSIALTYCMGKRMFNRKIGVIGALFFCVIPMHVWVSHLVNTDVPMTFFSLLALIFIWGVATGGRMYSYALAGVFTAVSINCKMLAIPLLIPFVVAHYLNWKNNDRSLTSFFISKETIYTSLFFLIGFIITNPAVVIGLPKFIGYFLHRADMYMDYDEFGIVPYSQNAYYDYYIMLKESVYGVPLLLMTIFGVAYSLAKREKADYILCSMAIGHFLLIANTNFLVQDRYLMLLVSPSLILTARLLVEMTHRISNKKGANTVLVVICAICLAFPTYQSFKYCISLTRDNTSKVSKKWIEENIVSGSKILLDAGKTLITFGPRLNESREKIYNRMNEIRNLKEGETFDSALVSIVDSYSAIYFELLLKTEPKVTYDITSTVLGSQLKLPDYYKANGFEYVITNADITWRLGQEEWRKRHPISVKFYEALDREFELIKTFEPTVTRSGPVIKVYRVQAKAQKNESIRQEVGAW